MIHNPSTKKEIAAIKNAQGNNSLVSLESLDIRYTKNIADATRPPKTHAAYTLSYTGSSEK